jgi:hypothetical protein
VNNKFRNLLEFEFVLNFKGVQTFWENPRNSPKLYPGIAYPNIIFYDITCIKDFNVPLQVAFDIFGEN